MSKKIVSRLLRRMMRCLESELEEHRDCCWLDAPEFLSKSMFGSDTKVRRARSAPTTPVPGSGTSGGRRPFLPKDGYVDRPVLPKEGYVDRPSVLFIRRVGLVGVEFQRFTGEKMAILRVADRWGRPLNYRFAIRGGVNAWWSQIRIGPSIGSRSKKQKIALVGGFHVDNYYHWITEVVGDIWFLKKMGINIDDIDFYALAGGEKEWQQEVLELLGLEPQKILPIKNIHVQKNVDLVVPHRSKSAETLPSWLSQALREELGYKKTNAEPYRKVYISRGDAKRRKVLNEEAVIPVLKRLGYEIWKMDGLSFRQQQELFSSSRIIVAPHGAALTNLVWCSEGSKIVDIFPDTKATPCFGILAMQCGIDYQPIWSKSKKGNIDHYHWDDIEFTGDVMEQIIAIDNEYRLQNTAVR